MSNFLEQSTCKADAEASTEERRARFKQALAKCEEFRLTLRNGDLINVTDVLNATRDDRISDVLGQ